MKEAYRKIATDVALFAASQVAFYYAFKYVMHSLDPNRQKRIDSKKAADSKLSSLGLSPATHPHLAQLSEHEEQISSELILPRDITETFDSIGGLDGIIGSLQESVIAPLCFPELFSSSNGLLGAPKGVLLYGPPGTGKTMLAKALAKESGATFINMHVSTLTNKWFGESNKLVSALFSLARKLQPTIIFIDEIDSFLRERGTGDHEVTGMMKAEFMTLWDGLTSGSDRIMVLGATNRPNDIDAAILRRMPKRYAVSLPDPLQRHKILSIMLKGTDLDKRFDLDEVVRRTEGYSGSDLKELCRAAAMIPVREVLRSESGRKIVGQAQAAAGGGIAGNGGLASISPESQKEIFKRRPLRNADFFVNDSAATPMTVRMHVASPPNKQQANGNARRAPPQDGLD
ncbi:putative MSP1-intra-mitochondrial sorting protein [Tilletiaria anomala UBC 951]|uniref:Putative MSP1-intra-mitochondrial sorting protein n=1 Tax=Tilletiaria anomala (strain ATCC 24038 / CBS 436.72 / UBC 951) TaxID=1037660 RepID=A0A066V7T0_TILAU|nr:putative MSP1-intra-mitochondrial sorting protein [Tilletiaria anomala UBC 951]KDN37536.1 putative MSP1-intra-mitochondrial sorting protein [Tilletiaria anomala UBC 951]